MLPNLLLFGTSRSGTTYLKRCLEQHPDIFMGSEGPYTGDIHFFNATHEVGKWEKGLEWYEGFFKGRTNQKILGQKSGLYFSDPEAPKLIRRVLGSRVKFIATLRNPIERAYSSYWYQIEDVPKGMSFLEACELEMKNQFKLASLLLSPGFYYAHLCNYLQYFDQEQFHFILFDFMIQDPLHELGNVYRFLRISENFIPQDYDKKVNQAIGSGGITYRFKNAWGILKRTFPELYKSIKTLHAAKWMRVWLGKSSEKAASKKGYPKMSPVEWEYCAKLYREDSKKMGEFLGIDLEALWYMDRL